jgi:cathepsin B
LYTVWKFMEWTGVALDTCLPYTSGDGDNGLCSDYCAGTENYKEKKYVKLWGIHSYETPDAIKLALINGGPIEAGFDVYEDFYNYSSGVYQHKTGANVGGHAIKIIGWGNQAGLEYWIAANSWGDSWGMDGYFNIAFGECGIDKEGIAGTPAVYSWWW